MKLEQHNNLSLFHKLVLLDLNDMFFEIVDKFSSKFKTDCKKKSIQSDANDTTNAERIKNARHYLSMEEKSTYDAEENNNEM